MAEEGVGRRDGRGRRGALVLTALALALAGVSFWWSRQQGGGDKRALPDVGHHRPTPARPERVARSLRSPSPAAPVPTLLPAVIEVRDATDHPIEGSVVTVRERTWTTETDGTVKIPLDEAGPVSLDVGVAAPGYLTHQGRHPLEAGERLVVRLQPLPARKRELRLHLVGAHGNAKTTGLAILENPELPVDDWRAETHFVDFNEDGWGRIRTKRNDFRVWLMVDGFLTWRSPEVTHLVDDVPTVVDVALDAGGRVYGTIAFERFRKRYAGRRLWIFCGPDGFVAGMKKKELRNNGASPSRNKFLKLYLKSQQRLIPATEPVIPYEITGLAPGSYRLFVGWDDGGTLWPAPRVEIGEGGDVGPVDFHLGVGQDVEIVVKADGKDVPFRVFAVTKNPAKEGESFWDNYWNVSEFATPHHSAMFLDLPPGKYVARFTGPRFPSWTDVFGYRLVSHMRQWLQALIGVTTGYEKLSIDVVAGGPLKRITYSLDDTLNLVDRVGLRGVKAPRDPLVGRTWADDLRIFGEEIARGLRKAMGQPDFPYPERKPILRKLAEALEKHQVRAALHLFLRLWDV